MRGIVKAASRLGVAVATTLATVLSMPATAPADPLDVELPEWDCGFLAGKDVAGASEELAKTNLVDVEGDWMTMFYVWQLGQPLAHAKVEAACWLQYGETYNENGAIARTKVACHGDVGDDWQCSGQIPSGFEYDSNNSEGLSFCGHAKWTDIISGDDDPEERICLPHAVVVDCLQSADSGGNALLSKTFGCLTPSEGSDTVMGWAWPGGDFPQPSVPDLVKACVRFNCVGV